MTEPAIRHATGGLRVLAIAGLVVMTCTHRPEPEPVARWEYHCVSLHRAAEIDVPDDATHARERRIPPTLWWAIASHVRTPEAWDVAAAVYDARVWRCTAERPVGEHAECVDPAFAAAIAARNALAAEGVASSRAPGFRSRAQTLHDAANNFAVLAFPDDGGWLMNEFRLAAQLWSCRHELALWGVDLVSRDPQLRSCIEYHSSWASSLHLEMRDPRFAAGNDDLRRLGLEPP